MTNPNLKTITGTVREVSSSEIAGGQNGSKRYTFVLFETDEGEKVKANNLVVDAHVDQVIRPGQHATFHIRTIRTFLTKSNLLLATESDIGPGFLQLPVSMLIGNLYLSIFGGLVLSLFFGGLAIGPAVYGLTGSVNLSFLLAMTPLYVLVWNALKLFKMRSEASGLRRSILGGSMEGGREAVAVTNI